MKSKVLAKSSKKNFSAGHAWYNFHINIETPPAANTIHQTYGICFQNTLPPEQIQISEKATTKIQDISISNNRKEKSCFVKKKDPEEVSERLESFCKNPRLTKFLFLEI